MGEREGLTKRDAVISVSSRRRVSSARTKLLFNCVDHHGIAGSLMRRMRVLRRDLRYIMSYRWTRNCCSLGRV